MSCCLCYPRVLGCSTPPKSACPDGNCLRVPHLLVGSDDSVGPCGEEGLVPFANTGLDTTLCGLLPPTFTILSYSDIFEDVSITSTGIYFTTTSATSEDPVGIIEYGVSCGQYAATATVTIILKNLCVGVLCATNQLCNRCTGVCAGVPGGIVAGGSVTGSTNNGGLTVI